MHIRVSDAGKFVRLILSWAASYKPKRANASMIIALFDISVVFFRGKVRKVIYVVPRKDLRKNLKIWRLLKSLYGTRDASQVFATYVEEGLNDHGFQSNAVVPCLCWWTMLEALGVHWDDDFICSIPDDRADDLEQLMREVFKVKICERIGPGCLTSVEFLHRKLAWSAEGFSWTHDPKHTLAMADGFGFNGKKQLEQTKWNVTVAPGSKTVGKGLRDGADGLDEQETQQYRSLFGTALYVGQDRPETQYATKEAARFMSDPTRAAKCMLKRLCKYYSEAPVLSWSFPYQEMPSEIMAVTDANWAGELEGLRSTSCGWIYFGDHLLETYSSTQQNVALSTAESEYISITKDAAHALEVRSAMVEYGMTFNVVCETDASAGRAMVTRRGVGRVRHLDARLLWLQQLCAKGVVEVRARPREHNEADLGTKVVDLGRMTSLLKGTPLRPPMGWSSWMVATTLTAFSEAAKDCRVLIWNVRNMCETSGWFWICVGMVIVILTVLSGGPFANPISDDCSWQNKTDENAAWRRPMKNELEHHEKVLTSGLCVEPCCEWCGSCLS